MYLYVFLFREDFAGDVTLDGIMGRCVSTGFQATNMGLAIAEINRMVSGNLLNDYDV